MAEAKAEDDGSAKASPAGKAAAKKGEGMITHAKVKEFLFVKHRFWVILITLFCASQVINVWAGMPDYKDWDVVFGFPLPYIQWKAADGFAYFNLIILIVDIVIVYLLLRAYLYYRFQMNKYEMPKDAKNEKKEESKPEKKK